MIVNGSRGAARGCSRAALPRPGRMRASRGAGAGRMARAAIVSRSGDLNARQVATSAAERRWRIERGAPIRSAARTSRTRRARSWRVKDEAGEYHRGSGPRIAPPTRATTIDGARCASPGRRGASWVIRLAVGPVTSPGGAAMPPVGSARWAGVSMGHAVAVTALGLCLGAGCGSTTGLRPGRRQRRACEPTGVGRTRLGLPRARARREPHRGDQRGGDVVPLVPRDGRDDLRRSRGGALLREHFVTIRVDADARPDVAERYRAWGWPATAILTPDARPVLELRGYQEARSVRGAAARAGRGSRRGPAGSPGAEPPRGVRHE